MTMRHTSIAAKASIGGVSRTVRAQIFLFILNKGAVGATLNEIVDGTGIILQTVCARRKELDDKLLVVDSKLRRLTPSRRSAIVWIVPPHVATAAWGKLKMPIGA